MKVEDIIEQGWPYCAPDETLQQVAERMCLWGCDVLPVCRADKRLVGSITSRAICLQACMTGEPLAGIRVRDATTEQPLCGHAEDGVRSLMDLMIRERVWHLPVIDPAGRLVGMISYGRLLQEISGTRDTMVIVPEVNTLDEIQADYDFMPTWTLVTKPRELISPEGKPAQLSRAEARLLLVLAESAGSVMDREALTRKVVQRSWHPTDRYIDVLVAHLRKKFGERGADARVIRTVPNDGYVFTLKVADERRANSVRRSRREERQAGSRPNGAVLGDVSSLMSAPT
jgi:DNA-binding winged helix-turn-helix (wHTH) protein/CBS domain-containing protein